MIIGGSKKEVIDNIKKAVEKGEYNTKVEINDPKLTSKEKKEIINNYLKNRNKISYKLKNNVASIIIKIATLKENKETKIEGIEKIKNIGTGAIITNNHFNPIDSTVIGKLIIELGKKKFYIIGEETNLAMKGFNGFIMNYANIIPISSENIGYMKRELPETISKKLNNGELILIYPEEEMWFNYRKPRILKQGAYYYATKNNVPVISCFTEMIDKEEMDNEEFRKVKYILHILAPIYPDIKKGIKQNMEIMANKDYEQKKEAYEKAYNKKLEYKFEETDIAGFVWK